MYGGFWLRAGAAVLDVVLVLIVAFGIRLIFVESAVSLVDNLRLLVWADSAIELAVFWLYFAFMESSPKGATLGKMAIGLRVVTDQGQRLSFANATGRFFAKCISAILLGIGFVMVAFSDKKRGLHDKMAATLVIRSP